MFYLPDRFAAAAGLADRETIRSLSGLFGIGIVPNQIEASAERSSLVLASTTTLTPFSVSAETGEKPQSKVWFNDGRWWAVMPSTSVAPAGTWIWRLEANNTWTNVLQISSATDTHADTKAVGNVTHILLQGASPSLISVEYVPASTTYQLWTGRPTATSLSLPNSETASFDIDSTGRMWVATENGAFITVYNSASPYTLFSGPTNLASNVDEDNLDIIAMPGGKECLVNQVTQRFGFKTHVDTDPTGTWSADEVPASQSALEQVGPGWPTIFKYESRGQRHSLCSCQDEL